MDITDLDKNLYNKYKQPILQAMQHTRFNLSKEITKILGPYYYCNNEAPCQPPYYGLIERKAHSYSGVTCNGNKEDLIKKAINYLNKLLLLDPWAAKQIKFIYRSENNGQAPNVINAYSQNLTNFNKEEYEQKLLIEEKNIKDIFPKKNGNCLYEFKPIDRLHLPPAIFYYEHQDGENEYRFGALIDEIKKHCPSVKIKIEGKNFAENTECDCLYVLSLSYECEWGKEKENGELKFPKSLKTWHYNTLDKYCDYYIVADGSYCDIRGHKEFSKIINNKITMKRSNKKYEYSHISNVTGTKHILVFDNYNKINITTTEDIIYGKSKI